MEVVIFIVNLEHPNAAYSMRVRMAVPNAEVGAEVLSCRFLAPSSSQSLVCLCAAGLESIKSFGRRSPLVALNMIFFLLLLRNHYMFPP